MLRFRALVPLVLQARGPAPRRALLRIPASHRAPCTTSAAFRRNHTSASRPKLCPSCSSPLPTALPVCTKCSYISPIPESMTYHEMLGTPYEPNPFIVDVPQLRNQFRALQAVVHPDRWVARPSDHQAMAAAMSSRVNEALHRLSNPLRRAEYILAQEGFAGEETDKLDDMELLMEVMEARENLASAESTEDVAEIRAENEVKINETLKDIERLAGEKDWEALRTAAVKLKYLQGVESAAAAWPEVVHDH